jgi:polysaccharide pyruvyl transferase CsaB
MHDINKVFRVGISGSYGGMNLGDEAILQATVRGLRSSLPVEITVFSLNAKDTLNRHDVESVIPVRDLFRSEVVPEVERLDLFILGGGGILYDAEAPTYLREAIIAQEMNIPVMVYAVGAGPLQDLSVQMLVRECLDRCSAVTVRERRTQQLLEQIGVTADIQVTADPALLIESESLPDDVLAMEGIHRDHRLVGMSVREPGSAAPDIGEYRYHEMLANAADYMVDRLDADLVFVPMERRVLDMQHSHAVIAQMAHADRATVLKGEYTPGQLLSVMGKFAFAVGMRLHFLLFAAMQRVPFVALPYASKVTGLLEALDMPTPPMRQDNSGQIIAHIDRSWDLRADIQAKITEALPSLQRSAQETNKIAVRLLTEQPHSSSEIA